MFRSQSDIVRHAPQRHDTYTAQIQAAIGWEPEVVDLYTSRNASDRSVRAIVRSDTGAILAGCGGQYTPRQHYTGEASIGACLDRVAVVLGITPAEHPAKIQTWAGGARLAVSLAVPEALADLLSVPSDPSGRGLSFLLRTSHDTSGLDSMILAIGRILCANGLLAPDASLLGKSKGKHTPGLTANVVDASEGAARALPEVAAAMGRDLRAFADRSLSREDVGHVLDAVLGVDTVHTRRTFSQVIDYVAQADGVYVPRAQPHQEHNALQVLEAATAYDRHTIGRPDRVLEDKALGPKVFAHLKGMI
jgi:hypothetical protein